MPAKYLTRTPFQTWTLASVSNAVGKQLSPEALRAMDFYNGNHWQGGLAWGGPVPDPATTNAEDSVLFMKKVEQLFTSTNVVAEVVDRHVSAVVGREPAWQFVPINAPEGAEEADPATRETKPTNVTEIEAAIVAWAEKRNPHAVILEAAADYATTGFGYVRLFIPPGLLTKAADGSLTVPSNLTPEEALDLVYIEKLAPTASGVAVERNTMSTGAYVRWDEANESSGTTQFTELQYLLPPDKGKRKTVLRSWEGQQESPQVTLDLGGNLLIHELCGKRMVTQQVMQLQKAMNFALTAMGNNNGQAGFLERVIINAQVPKKYTPDPKDPTGVRKLETTDPSYRAGPGKTAWLTGHPIYNEEGTIKGYTTPEPIFRDPSSPESFTASMAEYRACMYLESKQGHLLAQGDGSISGASRLQMRADFEVSLRDTRVAVEGTYRWMLAVGAMLVGVLTNKPDRYADLRPTVQANISTGPLTAEELTVIITQYEKGLRSRESTMNLIGVDDPDAEFLRILGELPNNPVSLDTLAMLTVTLLPEHVVALLKRAGFEVTPAQEATIKAAAAAAEELRNSAAKARDRSLNPVDDNPADNPPANGQ